jgi:carboxyl-terminal processing protease
MVYGGGGIVPDVFISLEGKQGEGSVAYLMQQSGFVGQFVFEQLDKHRLNFKGLTFEKFLVEMNRNEMYFTNFQKYLLQNGIEINLSKNKPLVKRYLSAEFARQLFDEQKYYEIVLKQDPMIQAVLNPKS